MLEAGVVLLTISQLLGYKSFTTTMIYLHGRRPYLNATPSPIDWLPVLQCPRWQEPAKAGGAKSLNVADQSGHTYRGGVLNEFGDW